MREKHIGFRTILTSLLFLALGMALSSGVAFGEERIPFTYPAFSAKKMPPVFFTHDQHIAYLEDKGQDCTACHQMTDDGLSETFLNVGGLPACHLYRVSCQACQRPPPCRLPGLPQRAHRI